MFYDILLISTERQRSKYTIAYYLPLGVVEEVDGRRRQSTLDRLTHVGVDVHLVGARLGHVIGVDQSRQLLPVRRVRRLPVLVALLPEYRVLVTAFVA